MLATADAFAALYPDLEDPRRAIDDGILALEVGDHAAKSGRSEAAKNLDRPLEPVKLVHEHDAVRTRPSKPVVEAGRRRSVVTLRADKR